MSMSSKLWGFLGGVLPRLALGGVTLLALGCSSSTNSARTCTEVECGQYGSCFELDAGAMCVCDDGYGGEDCSECADGYQKNGSRCVSDGQTGMMSCDDDPCGANGTCDDADGEVTCECDEGYTGDDCSECDDGYHADPDNEAVCLVDAACGGDSCPANASCDDTGGIVTCACDEGYDGADCTDCAAGYHDEGGACVEDTECGANTCPNGTCDDSSGVPVCTCNPGYVGEHCDECAPGYHADGDACVEDETCGLDSCPPNATCDDTGGVVTCECNEGYTGDDCAAPATECDPGLVENDAGACSLDCDEGTTLVDIAGVNPLTLPIPDGYELVPPDTIVFPDGGSITVQSAGSLVCLPLGYTCEQYDPCGGDLTRGYCEDQSGLPLCICNDAFAGLLCDQCAPGYHPDGDECLLDETCQPTTCNSQGTCDDATGAVTCSCATGYSGPNCRQCAVGYHQLPDGMCVPDEMCAADACNDHGSCQVVEGAAVCNCFAGYAGPTCSDCEAGYHLEGDVCVLDQTCSDNSCGGFGVCDDSSGSVDCTCQPGYTGPNCGECDVDYTRANGLCIFVPLPNTLCTSDTCNGHGTCDDTSGTAVCTCSSPYTGSRCGSCIAGYVLHSDGVCRVSTCGDGIRDGRIGEECDDGTLAQEDCPYGPTSCNACGGTNPNPVETRASVEQSPRYQPADHCRVVPGVPHYCGDSFNDGGANESCDDGGIPSDCAISPSGQLVDPSCGNLDACLNTCDANTCGDTFVNPGAETCDNGVNDAQYGEEGECASDCHLAAYCGDTITNGPEDCDDGIDEACDVDALDPDCVADNQDACTNQCTDNVCGDGIVYNPPTAPTGVPGRAPPPPSITAQEGSGPFQGQACDDGDLNTDMCGYEQFECLVCFPPGSSPKTPECTYQYGDTPYCGDHVVQSDEEVCDSPGYCFEPPLRAEAITRINSAIVPEGCEVCAQGCDSTEFASEYEFCGDGQENGPEQCFDEAADGYCPQDCDPCGDNFCDVQGNENPETCPLDCGVCGDGTCDAFENCECTVDCGPCEGPF